MALVELSIRNHAKDVIGKAGHDKAERATWAAVRKGIVEIERYHKRQEMLPGGGKKAWREPDPVKLRVRTGSLKRSYTRRLFKQHMMASYGSDLVYAPVHEYGSFRRNIRPRPGVQRTSEAMAPHIERWLAEALAKEGL